MVKNTSLPKWISSDQEATEQELHWAELKDSLSDPAKSIFQVLAHQSCFCVSPLDPYRP